MKVNTKNPRSHASRVLGLSNVARGCLYVCIKSYLS